jgi:hypothetical protein
MPNTTVDTIVPVALWLDIGTLAQFRSLTVTRE